MKIQYIRDWLNGSTANTDNHWVEIKALDRAGTNKATGSTVTTNGTQNSSYPIARIVDGDLATANYAAPGSGLVWVQVDLGTPQEIVNVTIWHYYGDTRTYHKTKTEVSLDGITWLTVFDSAVSGEYAESSSGKAITLKFSEPKDIPGCVFDLDLQKYNPGAIAELKDSLNNTIYGPQQVCNSDYSLSLSNMILRASVDLSASTSLEIVGALMVTDPTVDGTLLSYRPSGSTNIRGLKLICRNGYLVLQRFHDSLVSEVQCPYKLDSSVLLLFDYYLDVKGLDNLNVFNISSSSVLNRDHALSLTNGTGSLSPSLIIGGSGDDAGAGSELSSIKIYQLAVFSMSLTEGSRAFLLSYLNDKWGQIYNNYPLSYFTSDYGLVTKDTLSGGYVVLTIPTTQEY